MLPAVHGQASRTMLPNPRMQPTGRGGRRSARAYSSPRPIKGSVGLCGRGYEGLQLMRQSLGGSGLTGTG
jgi:hypothetical protein